VTPGPAGHCNWIRFRALVGARSYVQLNEFNSTMHNLDAHDAATTVQRTALECEAIIADLERLKMMITDAGDRLLLSFNEVGALASQKTRSEDDERRLAHAVANAVTALQFQDMANQLTSHAQRRLNSLQKALSTLADGVDPLLANSRLQPVRQAGMGAG